MIPGGASAEHGFTVLHHEGQHPQPTTACDSQIDTGPDGPHSYNVLKTYKAIRLSGSKWRQAMAGPRNSTPLKPCARPASHTKQLQHDVKDQQSSVGISTINLSLIDKFVQSIKLSRTLEQAVDVLHGVILELGCRRLVYARGSMVHHDRLVSPPDIIERDLPANWRTGYARRGYFDPYFRLPSATMANTEWSSIHANSARFSEPVREFIDYAHEIGMSKGFTVPIRTSPTQYALISAIDCIEDDSEIPETLKIILPLIACYFVNETMMRFEARAPDMHTLSKRESECLFWFAHGKSIQDIATILDISAETVPVYFKRLTSKLNASNRTHALAKAIKFGLIEITSADELNRVI
jgi:DNA-binding CsgD family transcriptional regulator